MPTNRNLARTLLSDLRVRLARSPWPPWRSSASRWSGPDAAVDPDHPARRRTAVCPRCACQTDPDAGAVGGVSDRRRAKRQWRRLVQRQHLRAGERVRRLLRCRELLLYNNDADLALRRFDRIGPATRRRVRRHGLLGQLHELGDQLGDDILRYGLTGGDRVVDTASLTVLQRAYLPTRAATTTRATSTTARISRPSGSPTRSRSARCRRRCSGRTPATSASPTARTGSTSAPPGRQLRRAGQQFQPRRPGRRHLERSRHRLRGALPSGFSSSCAGEGRHLQLHRHQTGGLRCGHWKFMK